MFEKDSQVKGKVTRTSPYGIFVELTPGVEGLIHISKVTPGTEPKSGEEITCLVEDVKPDARKISLSMALTEKPIGYKSALRFLPSPPFKEMAAVCCRVPSPYYSLSNEVIL